MDTFRNFLTAVVLALAVGIAAGWLRYWFGFLVIFHGAACAGAIGWLFHRARSTPPRNFVESNATVWRWSLPLLPVFWAGQLIGTGLAQPWFEPLGYFIDIVSGTSVETFIGVGTTHVYGGGMSGFMWAFCILLDAAVMWLLLAVALRDDEPQSSSRSQKGKRHGESS